MHQQGHAVPDHASAKSPTGRHFELVLASASAYRQQLLTRLGVSFMVDPANIDEQQRPNERAADLAQRLADEKSSMVQARHPQAIVIGSDQVAECNGEILGKPGTLAAARQQLQRSSGQCVAFYTAVCVRDGDQSFAFMDTTRVHMRALSDDEIDRYLALEAPLDCAGALKSEGAGIALMASMETVDPTALIGLPLITLAEQLRRCGLTLP